MKPKNKKHLDACNRVHNSSVKNSFCKICKIRA